MVLVVATGVVIASVWTRRRQSRREREIHLAAAEG
jgi:hypothetical protein